MKTAVFKLLFAFFLVLGFRSRSFGQDIGPDQPPRREVGLAGTLLIEDSLLLESPTVRNVNRNVTGTLEGRFGYYLGSGRQHYVGVLSSNQFQNTTGLNPITPAFFGEYRYATRKGKNNSIIPFVGALFGASVETLYTLNEGQVSQQSYNTAVQQIYQWFPNPANQTAPLNTLNQTAALALRVDRSTATIPAVALEAGAQFQINQRLRFEFSVQPTYRALKPASVITPLTVSVIQNGAGGIDATLYQVGSSTPHDQYTLAEKTRILVIFGFAYRF